MTSIQVNNASRKEAERANRAREKENERSNRAQEAETHRANVAKETLNKNVEKRQQISTLSDILTSAIHTIRDGRSNKISNASNSLKGIGTAISVAKSIGALANDPKWYEVSEQITKDVASISAFQPTGTIPALDDSIGKKTDFSVTPPVSSTMDEGHRFAVAGYCHFSYLPSIGRSLYTTNNSDAVNIAAQNIYSYMRNQVSGSVKNYERADYMMYLLAVNGPISYYSWMKRIYGILNYANLYNKYLPRHLLTDMNVNYADLSGQIANLRGYINQFAVRINATLAIPSRMPLYARHQFLNTYMFSDSTSKKHQLYFFSPRKYYIWKVDPNNQATMLDLEDPWTYNSSSSLTLSEIINFGNYMLDTLLSEEDVGIMVGDTVKAFGETELVKLPSIPDNYVVEIGTSDEILDQITNIKFIKKNLIGVAGYPNSGVEMISVVGYDPLDGLAPATHTFDFRVRQNTATQQIYSPCTIDIELDMTGVNSAVKGIWDNANRNLEDVLVCNDTENAVELNFLTDDTSPSRVMTSTRLAPVCSFENPTTIRDANGKIQYLKASGRAESCGSEVIVEGFTSVLYWDSVNNEAKVATYELYDGINSFTTSVQSNNPLGTGFTADEVFVSDFDYHPCIYLYRTENSGGHSAPFTRWIRRYAKLWDRNVSTYVPKETMSHIHGTALMGEFNLAQIGLVPKAKL